MYTTAEDVTCNVKVSFGTDTEKRWGLKDIETRRILHGKLIEFDRKFFKVFDKSLKRKIC